MVPGWQELVAGLGTTLLLTLCASSISLGVGVVVAAMRLSGAHALSSPARVYVSFMRGTPALVQLFMVFFGLPMLGLAGHPFGAAATAIGLNSAAYVSEIMRAAILTIPAGQREAAESIGMTAGRFWFRILLPQALQLSLPALTNEATLVLKTTPLASVVAVTELTFSGQMIIARTYEAGRVLAVISLAYVAASMVITQGSVALGHRLQARG